jgi:V-type H+-transporting ATPase subunit d
MELAVAEDFDQIRTAMEKVPAYAGIFARLGGAEGQMLDKLLYEEEVRRCKACYDQQFHYAVFYAYMRLAEQEIRNLMWVSECVAQDQKLRIQDGICTIF